VRVELEFHLLVVGTILARPPADKGRLSAEVERVMEELTELPEAADPFVGVDLETGEVDIALTVEAEDPLEAHSKAATLIRTAIHAAGGGTPGWDHWKVQRVASSEEKIASS
jgi:hypothetical protein